MPKANCLGWAWREWNCGTRGPQELQRCVSSKRMTLQQKYRLLALPRRSALARQQLEFPIRQRLSFAREARLEEKAARTQLCVRDEALSCSTPQALWALIGAWTRRTSPRFLFEASNNLRSSSDRLNEANRRCVYSDSVKGEKPNSFKSEQSCLVLS